MKQQMQLQPLFFNSRIVGEALDNYDIADPHRRADEFDDNPTETAPRGNLPLYDTSITTPIVKSNISLTYMPDYSDQVLSDYRIKKMLGQPIEIPNVVDLDTAPNYVNFIKNTIRNVITSENEFNIEGKENMLKDVFAK